MPLYHRHRVLPVLLAASVFTLAACNQESDDKSKDGSAAPTAAASVELWTMQLKPTFEGYVGGLLKEWEKSHPGVTVRWVDLPSTEIENKTLTAAASGKAPDLVNLNPAFANKLANAGALLPLSIEPTLKALYFDAGWQANTVNNEVVGIPWYLSTSVTLYNKALWKQAGLKEGAWPRTFKELADASRQIKAKTKALGFMPNFGDRGKFMEVLAQEGVPLLSGDRKHAGFNTAAGVAVVETWASLIKDGIIPRESLTQGHRESVDRFQAGQTAVFPAGPQFLKIIQENSPQLYGQLDVGPQISGASGLVGVGVMNLVIPKSSQQQSLAFDLAKFITSGPNQLAFSKLVPILPSVKTAAADAYFKKPDATIEARARTLAAEQLQRATLLVPPLPKQAELSKSLDDALTRAALGRQTAAESLEQAADEWNRLLTTP